jgi:hypothetical protein
VRCLFCKILGGLWNEGNACDVLLVYMLHEVAGRVLFTRPLISCSGARVVVGECSKGCQAALTNPRSRSYDKAHISHTCSCIPPRSGIDLIFLSHSTSFKSVHIRKNSEVTCLHFWSRLQIWISIDQLVQVPNAKLSEEVEITSLMPHNLLCGKTGIALVFGNIYTSRVN